MEKKNRTAFVRLILIAVCACLLTFCAKTSTAGDDAAFNANLVCARSHAEIEKWVFSTLDGEQPDAAPESVRMNQKFHLAFIVDSFEAPARKPVDLLANLKMVDPNGKTVMTVPKAAFANMQDPRAPGIVVLQPIMAITFDKTDPVGTYTFESSILDRSRGVSAFATTSIELVR